MAHIILVNDGDCWLCEQYAMYVQIKKNHTLEIKDARQEHKLVAELFKKGFDINDGVIAIIDGKVYQGKEAVRCIEELSENKTWYQKLVSRIIKTPLFHVFYPLTTQLRIWLLKLHKKSSHISTTLSKK